MWLTTRQIGLLCARDRFWAHRAVRRGVFGDVAHRKGRREYIALAAVQQSLGVTFTPEQLRAAGVWLPPERESA